MNQPKNTPDPAQSPAPTSADMFPPRSQSTSASPVRRLVDEHVARRAAETQDARHLADEETSSWSTSPPPTKGPSFTRRTWRRAKPLLWRSRVAPAFWTVASILSLVINIILIVVIILLGRKLFFMKVTMDKQFFGGLDDNFLLMDQAHIKTTILVSDTIQVQDTIPVVFDLPLTQNTNVVLINDTPVDNATIYLNNQPVPLDLVLKAGTVLGIQLDMTVPVNQTIPITLNVPVQLEVPVDIPLDQTELHKPFLGLHKVISPYLELLSKVPDSWEDVCKGTMQPICRMLRFNK
jgi:hypothetical protein